MFIKSEYGCIGFKGEKGVILLKIHKGQYCLDVLDKEDETFFKYEEYPFEEGRKMVKTMDHAMASASMVVRELMSLVLLPDFKNGESNEPVPETRTDH